MEWQTEKKFYENGNYSLGKMRVLNEFDGVFNGFWWKTNYFF